MIEGLSVVAFLAAIVVWQSDGTRQAAGRFVASFRSEAPAEPDRGESPIIVAGDTRPVRTIDLSRDGTESGVDPVRTGSIVPPSAFAIARLKGWVSACDSDKATFCTASQSLSAESDPAIETSWTIEKSPEGLVGVWTVPTDVLIDRGMTLIVGDGTPKTVPYASCGAASCKVRAKLAPNFIGLLRGSKRIATEIMLRNGRVITFDFSRKGLPEALEKLGV
ncbi:invasion associated locus B family protein [Kaistia dalseonensis]|uniref:Invasion protein IalB n=1 Tax=Kaistia dalseonensis TaxID=410840 RepID=A0ABU0HCW7_9HYPH|nr:invasion associated locus B family protein [Kaistia dalseonensis]MCX5497528.1 invasion associated locus B family protein [Kaistia dalseonensis]MDQ0440167.1 invasion protein IalB [Kaistia dalseonensis]